MSVPPDRYARVQNFHVITVFERHQVLRCRYGVFGGLVHVYAGILISASSLVCILCHIRPLLSVSALHLVYVLPARAHAVGAGCCVHGVSESVVM